MREYDKVSAEMNDEANQIADEVMGGIMPEDPSALTPLEVAHVIKDIRSRALDRPALLYRSLQRVGEISSDPVFKLASADFLRTYIRRREEVRLGTIALRYSL